MKVKDLIAELSALNQDADIKIKLRRRGYPSIGIEIINGVDDLSVDDRGKPTDYCITTVLVDL